MQMAMSEPDGRYIIITRWVLMGFFFLSNILKLNMLISFHCMKSSLSENLNYFEHKLGYCTESRLSIINIHLLCCLLFFYCRLNLVIQFGLGER